MAIRPLDMETGFWRPRIDGSLEVVMCNPAGYAEVWYGSIEGAKIELVTDAVVRTGAHVIVQRKVRTEVCGGSTFVEVRVTT